MRWMDISWIDTQNTQRTNTMSPRAPHTRLLCILSILCCCMVSLVAGTSYNYGFDVVNRLKVKRQSPGIIVTTGMPLNRDGGVPVRLEVRDLQQDPDRWALYILALDMMQYTDQSDQTSWYSIMGTSHSVHCYPYSMIHFNIGSEADLVWLRVYRCPWCAF